MKLEEVMVKVKDVVDAELQQFFAGKRKEAERIHSSVVALVDQVADLTLRAGKRHRPFLCWVGYSAVIASEARQSPTKTEIASSPSAPRNDKLMYAMLGLELFQTFALIHDDIMDESKERRGGKTVHEYFRTQNPELNDQQKQHFGESMAILAGDLALVWADELIALSLRGAQATRQSHITNKQEIALPSERSRNDINKLYEQMKEEVVYGQALDIAGGPKQQADELKTAYYSVVRPLQTGSILAAVLSERSESKDLLSTWERYGVAVGKLFQLRDDVMDGEMTEEAFGRQARRLELQAHESLETLEASDEAKQLLADFIQFVQKRKS